MIPTAKAAGETVLVRLPDGKRVRVRLPEKVEAGSTLVFEARVPVGPPLVMSSFAPNSTSQLQATVPPELPSGTTILKVRGYTRSSVDARPRGGGSHVRFHLSCTSELSRQPQRAEAQRGTTRAEQLCLHMSPLFARP